jgi:sialidase-1
MKRLAPFCAVLALVFTPLGAGPVQAQETAAAPAGTLRISESLWHGFNKQTFPLDAHVGYVVTPKSPAPGKPWVWRTSFPDYHAETDILLLERGYHVAHLDVVSMLGADSALDRMDAFYSLVRQRWGLAEKPALEAVSRGGLPAYRYAARRPERVACIYADVPVMDLKSWPLQREDSRKPLQDALKFYGWNSEEELRAYKGNPLDLLAQIARAKIPLRHLISLNDKVVPPEQNTLEAQRRLQAMGWDIELAIVAEGNKLEGHHFPMAEAEKTAAFIEKHAAVKAATP